MTLRLAQTKDVQTVAAIFRRAVADMCDRFIFQWDDIYPSEEMLRQDIDNGDMYLLCDSAKIVGVIVINEDQYEEYSQGCWKCNVPAVVVHRFCIDPPCQHQGYGKHAMQLAHIMLKERGYQSVRLDVFSQNPHALNLYESLGYIQVGRVEFRKGLFYLFEKSL